MSRRALWVLAGLVPAVAAWALSRHDSSLHEPVRAILCAVGALCLALRGIAATGSPRRALLTLMLVVWASLTLGWMLGRPLERLAVKHEIRDWSWYHYYLGGKYFEEMGYRDLYDQTLAADRDGPQQLAGITRIRDLRTYQVEAANYYSRERSPAWTDARWAEFQRDLKHFRRSFDAAAWRRVLSDRGYNGTPAGTALYRLVGSIPLKREPRAWIGVLDPLLLLLALLAVGRAFGPFKALMAGTWVAIFYGNEGHLVGNPILYDWLAAMLGSMAAVRLGRPRLGGALLGYAAVMRVFPGFLLLGLVLWGFGRRRQRLPPRPVAPFLQGAAAALLLGFAVGCAGPHGPGAWREWVDNMAVHSEDHRFGNKRIGLQHPFTHDLTVGFDWRTREWRERTWPRQRWLWGLGAALLCGLFAAAALRDRSEGPAEAMILALAVVFATLVLSRYYASAGALLFLLGGRERDGPAEGWLAAALVGGVSLFYVFAGLEASQFGRYALANAVWFLLWLGILAWRIRSPRQPA